MFGPCIREVSPGGEFMALTHQRHNHWVLVMALGTTADFCEHKPTHPKEKVQSEERDEPAAHEDLIVSVRLATQTIHLPEPTTVNPQCLAAPR